MKKNIINLKINSLRKVLNRQIENKEELESIIKTSRKIDTLLNVYYKSIY